MRKRLFRTLAMVLLVMHLFTASVSGLTGIDLSRIKFSVGEKPVYFKFGNLKIEGALRQVYPFTEKEITDMVYKILKSMGLTQLDIVELNRAVEKAKRAADFTKEDYERIKENIIITISTVPEAGSAANILSVINQYMSSSSWSDIGTVSVDLLTNSLNEKVKETASGYIEEKFGDIGEDFVKDASWGEKLASIVYFCDMLADEYAHDKQKWHDIAQGAIAKRKLNEFYDKLQDEVDAYRFKSNEAGWNIDFDHAKTHRIFTFFEVDNNLQFWSLDMLLKQNATDEYGSIVGTYEGEFIMVAQHDMNAFTSGIDEAVKEFKPVKQFINTMGSVFKPSYKKASDGSADIERVIGGTAKAEIDKYGEIHFSLDENNSETMVEFKNILVNISLNTGTDADKYVELYMESEISNKEEDVLVTFSSMHTNTDRTRQLYPMSAPRNAEFNAGGSGSAGWDDNIWSPWDGTEKTLSFEW